MRFAALSTSLALLLLVVSPAGGASVVITTDADFDTGSFTSTNRNPPPGNAVKLDSGIVTPFDHIWVAASGRGTAVRIDTNTGSIFGEYRTAPSGLGLNPSRTTVDANGDVWIGNRNQGGGLPGQPGVWGSVVKISASPTGTTSSGLGDILAWTNLGGADTAGGTSTAVDTAIELFVRTPDADAVRHVSVDSANNVWVGGYPFTQRSFLKLDGTTGAILDSFDARPFGAGGYGGLIDGNGILWSASISQNRLLRYDIAAGTGTTIGIFQSYGLGIDTNGNIWNSMYNNNTIAKIAPNGAILGTFATGGAAGDRGVAVTPIDNNVWVANSAGNTVSRLDNAGNILKIITVGSTPTGLSVDSNGKVWVTNLNSNNVMRIDPNGGGDGLGAVDLTVGLGAGAAPYNYSDMTGTVLIGSTIPTGTWFGSFTGAPDTTWDTIFWNTEADAFIPGDGSLVVEARLGGGTWMPYASGDALGLTGGILEVRATFMRGPSGLSPILSDIRVDFTPGIIPEPSTFALLGVGVLGLLGLARRRRRI